MSQSYEQIQEEKSKNAGGCQASAPEPKAKAKAAECGLLVVANLSAPSR